MQQGHLKEEAEVARLDVERENQFNAFPSERNDITLEYDRLRNEHNP